MTKKTETKIEEESPVTEPKSILEDTEKTRDETVALPIGKFSRVTPALIDKVQEAVHEYTTDKKANSRREVRDVFVRSIHLYADPAEAEGKHSTAVGKAQADAADAEEGTGYVVAEATITYTNG